MPDTWNDWDDRRITPPMNNGEINAAEAARLMEGALVPPMQEIFAAIRQQAVKGDARIDLYNGVWLSNTIMRTKVIARLTALGYKTNYYDAVDQRDSSMLTISWGD